MSSPSRKDEVSFADQFLLDKKTLYGPPPEFGLKQNSRRKKGDSSWEAIWPIANSMNVAESGQLRVLWTPASDKPFTIAVVYRSNCLFRLDFVSLTICHSNPLFSRGVGLPPMVCGPHFHSWDANRMHILSSAPLWELACREPLPAQIRRFDQAFPWLADKVNLILRPDQRQFGPPDQLV
jgi:hypothetical protein